MLPCACTPARTYVLDMPVAPAADLPAATSPSAPAVAIKPASENLEPSSPLLATFHSCLAKHLADSPAIELRDDAPVTISYRLILHIEGDTPVRVGSGLLNLLGSPFYGLGDGAVGFDIVYADRSGKPLGRIIAEGPISGILGTPDDAINTAARNVATFTRMNYFPDAVDSASPTTSQPTRDPITD